MAELKPCPFCGSDDLSLGSRTGYNYETAYYVVCHNCCACIDDPFVNTKDRAIEAWNRRADNEKA